MSFWIAGVVGLVLGFGAGVALFLPFVWRQVRLEDSLDDRERELKRMVATIERLKHNLDEMVGRRDRAIWGFSTVDNGDKTALNEPKIGSGMGDYGGR